MKYFLAIAIGLFVFTAHAEDKKVCVKQMDAKTKKEKEVCKTIKVHKKLTVTDQKK